MAITSTSTMAEVLAQYNDNLSWDGDAAKAALALEAVRWLLVNRPAEFAINNHSTKYSMLEAEKKRLEEFISISSSTARSRICTFTRGKMRL
ncbi:MAG TPA: hypothetical protein DCP47_02840 [Phycisphaerales bacterium]|nr:hypothetical protein [Phycisphaerales bacterium]